MCISIWDAKPGQASRNFPKMPVFRPQDWTDFLGSVPVQKFIVLMPKSCLCSVKTWCWNIILLAGVIIFLWFWAIHKESMRCREPVWGIPPVTRSWGRKLTFARRAQTSGAPLEIPKHVPQQKSAGFCALLFHSSDILWKKSIQGFSLLHLKECFNPKTPLMAF